MSWRLLLLVGFLWLTPDGTRGSLKKALAGQECKIAILGDSLTAGYGVAAAEALPSMLDQALKRRGFDCAIEDAGVSGDTSAGGLARVDWVMADKPSHLIVELGGNDGLRALPVDQLERNLAEIIKHAQSVGAKVALLGIVAPPNLGISYTESFRAVFRRLADQFEIPLYPFLLDRVITDPDLMQADRIHPNAKGVAHITENILPFITSWLNATGVAGESH
ncbi:arylesterase [Arboricoccus pini]|uniref:arylesterase n=1 Tax=Arboricoccus pini TaxID=1963835 RepID=UPI001FAF11B1|nr:arylesterase [Arboricoccus pini]